MTEDRGAVQPDRVVIEGWSHLIALHRALIEARLHSRPTPENRAAAGDPLVASLAVRTAQAIVATHRAHGDAKRADGWAGWLKLSKHPWITRRVTEYARSHPDWRRWYAADKREYVRAALAPFTHTRDEVELIVREADGTFTDRSKLVSVLSEDDQSLHSGTALVVSGPDELLALHRTLLAAKFHPDPENSEVVWSPLVAEVCRSLVDALVETHVADGQPDRAASLSTWRQLSKQPWVAPRIVEYGRAQRSWSKWSLHSKRSHVGSALAPFEHSADDVQAIIDQADELRAAFASEVVGTL